MQSNNYYVYQLRKEGAIRPFYIGKGVGDRLHHHLRKHSLRLCNRKNSVIKSCLSKGIKIHVEKLKTCLTDDEAKALEVLLISLYGRADTGTGILTNMTDGGDGRVGQCKESARKVIEKCANNRAQDVMKTLDIDLRSIDNACMFNASKGGKMKKLIGYLRVSTDEQEASGNGLEAQRAAIVRFAADNDCEIIEFVEEALSAKLGIEDRPVLKAAMNKCLKMKATLCVSKLDRLSRHAVFILNMMERSLRFVVVQFGFDADEFMIHMYAVLGEKERKMIGQRTKDALEMLSRDGVQLGFARHKDPASIVQARAKGAAKNSAKADEFAAKMRPTIERMRNCGMSFSAIARELNETGTKTVRGGEWAPMTVSNLVARWAAPTEKEAA